MCHLERHQKMQPEIKSKEQYNAECKPQLHISVASKGCVGKYCLGIKHMLLWVKKELLLPTPRFSNFKAGTGCDEGSPAVSKAQVNWTFMILYTETHACH